MIIPVKVYSMIFNIQTDTVLANSVDPDQTAPEEQSDQGLHCLLFCQHLLGTLQKC